LPRNGFIVRGQGVPIFGVASAKDFKLYRVEYGVGRKPKEWHVIKVSTSPEPSDPWAEGRVKWDPNRGAHGNLATWDTGLTSYEHQPNPSRNLGGTCTLRLVVEDKSGKTAEASVVVQVGRAVTRGSGGIGESPDGKVFLEVKRHSTARALMVVGIQAVDAQNNPALIEIKAPKDLIKLGGTYEFRPPGTKFMRPAEIRIAYDPKELKVGGVGIPPDKLGVYAYEPVRELWQRVDGSKANPAAKLVAAPVDKITPYIAYYALMADLTAPPPPTLKAAEPATERSTVDLSGTAEPYAKVEILGGGAGKAADRADAEGEFRIVGVALEEGENRLAARTIDGAGNTSELSAPVSVVRGYHPPKSVKRVEILGKPRAERGGMLLVKLSGEDSDPKANTARARLVSESDPKGIELELVETGPQTGVYVRTFSVGTASDGEKGVIKAVRHGEKVTAAWADDAGTSAQIVYADTVAPPAPGIDCATHPSLCQDTFEGAKDPLGQWENIDREYGAALSMGAEGENGYLKLAKPQSSGHLGASASRTAYSAAEFPLLAFDYLVRPDVTMDVEVRRGGGWELILFNDPKDESPKLFGRPTFARFRDVRSDGKWHRAELDLGAAIAAADPGDEDRTVEEVRFINWDMRGAGRLEFGRTGGKGASFLIDNFRILGYGGPDADFEWSTKDDNGVAGYSWLLDREPNTPAPKEVKGQETRASFKGLAEGRWYFHVRAQDKPGNWGPTNHYMIFVDTKPPAASVVEAAEAGAGPRNWDEPVRITIDDSGGSGLDPGSVRLRVSGVELGIGSPALAYDANTGVLTFDPAKAKPAPWLFSDGAKVQVELAAAADHAGHKIAEPLVHSYRVRSPLKVTPPEPDGKNGWYVTAPRTEMRAPEGSQVLYQWAVTAKQDEFFRRGASVNALTVTVIDKAGKKQVYWFPVRLDKTVPAVKSRPIARPDGEPLIALEHDDYALEPGGLRRECFESPDLAGEPFHTEGGSDPGDPRLPASVIRRARSVRWSGRLLPPTSGVYEITLNARSGRAELALDGDVVLESRGRPSSKRLLLKDAARPVELCWYGREPGAEPQIWLSWQPPGMKQGRVPRDAMLAVRPLAKIYYRWDGGEELEYTGPLAPPAGAKTLHYRAVDEAGNEGTPGSLALD
jgi:hypothetical protein